MGKRIVAWVEPDPNEQERIRTAMAEQADSASLTMLASGAELIKALASPPARSQDCPDIVFLNLEVTQPDGVEVVRRIKVEPCTRRTPIMAYAYSDRCELIWSAYSAGVNACITAPSSDEALRRVVMGSLAFWLTTARLPAHYSMAAPEAAA